jgi:hypothetical protein
VKNDQLNAKDIVVTIKDAGFPADSFIVVGGAVLAIHELRTTPDIDIVCTEELMEELKQKGWAEKNRPGDTPGRTNGIIEAYLNVNSKDVQPTFIELRTRATAIDGIHFASIEDILALKKAYGRPKDLEDIELLRQYREKLEARS